MRFWDWQSDARRSTRWLVLLFSLCVMACIAAVHVGLTLAWLLLLMHWGVEYYPRGFLLANVGVSLMLILGGWWLTYEQLSAGGVALARSVGAREARPGNSPEELQLCNIVQEMCLAAQMRPPVLLILARAEAINAFAAGWNAEDAVIAVTQGALDHLSREEMQGLVAHELSHLKEGDTYLNMQLAGMVSGLELIYHFGETLRERSGLGWWFGNAVMAAGWVGWFSAQLLKAAVSRQREFLAQREVAQAYTGGWEADMRSHQGLNHPLVQHMLLAEVPDSGRLAHWLDAHPPLQVRITRIYGCPMRALPLNKGR